VGAAASAAALSSTGAAQQAFGGWLSDASNFDGTVVDETGNAEVTVQVGTEANQGNNGFGPPAVRVDPGTTITFEWVSNNHNVLPEEVPSDSDWQGHSGIEGQGFTYSHTFEVEGIYKYYCDPHLPLGMKGAIVVGDAEVTQGGGGDGGGGGTPAWPSYIGDANVDSYRDFRGQSSVSVTVGAGSGGLAFDPTKIWIDPGTEVTFEWVSNNHNVLPESQPSGAGWSGSSAIENTGFTYSHTFETEGIYAYYCQPHEAAGMKGAIAVGENVPRASPDEGGGGGITLPGGDLGFVLFAIAFGSLGIGALSVFAAEFVGSIRRTPRELEGYEADEDGTVREVPPELEGATEELEHDEYDPTGTASLIFIYFLILAGMWVFVYFVEFLGNGPSIMG
jgi:halocyanin-like protein